MTAKYSQEPEKGRVKGVKATPARRKPPRTAHLSFDMMARAVGLPAAVREHQFHPSRRWRFDFAWLEQKLAMEVQGGLFVQGRHSRGAALLKEHEKLNAAAALGWRVLYVTPTQIANGDALRTVEAALLPGSQ